MHFKETNFAHSFHFFFIDFIYLFFREREERENERERNISWLHLVRTHHLPETKPQPQARALTRNQTGKLSRCQTTPALLGHTSQGSFDL